MHRDLSITQTSPQIQVMHQHTKYGCGLHSSAWTCLLISCALFTIACVHLDHAFPFDLTQLYSTVNKQHSAGISVATVQNYADQRMSSQRRKRIKAATTSTSTTTTSSTTSTTTATPRTATTAITETTSAISRKSTPVPNVTQAPNKLPAPPYTLNQTSRSKDADEESAPRYKSKPESESVAELLMIRNHKQRKMTPFPKQSSITIETKFGKAIGMVGDVMGKDVSAFLGIPYARAPVNKLRFQRTAKPRPWKEAINASTFKPHCVQDFREDLLLSRSLTTLIMSEDCLYMNIWSADVATADVKPVIVWVYGGSFKGGTANLDETDGRVLAALGDVVVVTFNYRAGALGFLDLLSPDASGNQGIYDIVQALDFVRENIANFGGDPHRITLVGQDTGAISTGLLISSPKAKNLFQRAILQSGSPLFQDYFEGKNLKSSQAFAEEIGCATCATLKDKMQCLRGKTTSEILAAQNPLLVNDHHLFGPTFCEAIIPAPIIDSLQNEDQPLNVKEVLLGSNRDELSLSLVLDYPDMFNNRRINLNITTLRELRDLIMRIFSNRGNMHNENSIQYLVDFFFTSGEQNGTTEDLIRRMYRVFGDAAVGCPVNIYAEQLVRRNVKVFLYEFNQRAQNMVWDAWMGVPIGTEIPYLFGHPLRYPRVYSKDDLAISKRLISTWSQFARNGTVPDQMGQNWEEFTTDKPSFLEINPREAAYGSRVDNGVCNIFRIALQSRNESVDIDCGSKSYLSGDNIDIDQDLYETTTMDSTASTEASTSIPTEAPVSACSLFADDSDGPSIDYYDYKVIDLKIVPVIGSKAVFYCDPDQEMIGEQISTCGPTGVWTSEKPICRKNAPGQPRNTTTLVPHFFCDFFPEPLKDERLRVQYENLYEVNETMKFAVKGSKALFQCFPMNAVDRVRLVGQEVVHCSKYGIWSAIEPSCETVVQIKRTVSKDFKQQFFLIGLILVITLALFVVSFILYSKLSIKEYSILELEKQRNRKAHLVRKSLERMPIDGRREERELLQVNQEFTGGSEISPEDMEIISILSKARYGPTKFRERVNLVDHNRNIIGTRGGSTGDDDSDESRSTPETVLWVHR